MSDVDYAMVCGLCNGMARWTNTDAINTKLLKSHALIISIYGSLSLLDV